MLYSDAFNWEPLQVTRQVKPSFSNNLFINAEMTDLYWYFTSAFENIFSTSSREMIRSFLSGRM